MSHDTSSLVIDNIGLLVTNDPSLGSGPLGELKNASVVITDGFVESIGPSGAAADWHIDADGACVLPGFVDSHTHLVFAGDRSEEFTARMAGKPYDGGGIRVTTDATRRTSTDELHRLLQLRLAEAHRAGTTTIEIKSGYGLNVDDEVRSLEIAKTYTAESTFLGAHLLPSEFEGRADDYIDLVCGEMLDGAAGHSKWIDAFCETGAFDVDQSRAVLEAGKAAGLGLRLHGNQLGHGHGVQLAVECGCASVDHCTYLSDGDIEALTRLVEQAGGRVTGSIGLTQEFVDANSAEKLLSVVNSPIVPAGAQLSTGSIDQGSQAGDLLGIALLDNPDPAVAPVDDASRDTVLAALRDTGFVTYGTQRIGAADAALVVTGGALADDAGNQGATVARLAAGLAPHGAGTVLVGRDGSASGTAAVAVTRSDAALNSAVSTVDDVDREPGRITAVLALSDLVNGGSPGQFGTGPGASAVTVAP